MPRPNILRQKLANGEPTLSTHLTGVWPAEVEAIGHTGLYDYVEFVAEYGSFDLHDLDNLCRAAELHNMGSMIKVDQSLMPYLAQRGIGAGFGSVLFTDAAGHPGGQGLYQGGQAGPPGLRRSIWSGHQAQHLHGLRRDAGVRPGNRRYRARVYD